MVIVVNDEAMYWVWRFPNSLTRVYRVQGLARTGTGKGSTHSNSAIQPCLIV
jgi:hypothetical protein